jgi:hypothetical protein
VGVATIAVGRVERASLGEAEHAEVGRADEQMPVARARDVDRPLAVREYDRALVPERLVDPTISVQAPPPTRRRCRPGNATPTTTIEPSSRRARPRAGSRRPSRPQVHHPALAEVGIGHATESKRRTTSSRRSPTAASSPSRMWPSGSRRIVPMDSVSSGSNSAMPLVPKSGSAAVGQETEEAVLRPGTERAAGDQDLAVGLAHQRLREGLIRILPGLEHVVADPAVGEVRIERAVGAKLLDDDPSPVRKERGCRIRGRRDDGDTAVGPRRDITADRVRARCQGHDAAAPKPGSRSPGAPYADHDEQQRESGEGGGPWGSRASATLTRWIVRAQKFHTRRRQCRERSAWTKLRHRNLESLRNHRSTLPSSFQSTPSFPPRFMTSGH